MDHLARIFGGFPEVLLGVIGTALLLLTLHLMRRAMRITSGDTVLGTIIRYDERKMDDDTFFVPVVRFDTGLKGTFEVQSQTKFLRKRPYETGGIVPVRYDAENPEIADISSNWRQAYPAIATMVLAAGSFAAAWHMGG